MKTTLEIQNLKCGGCAHTISTKMTDVSGIDNVLVSLETSEVSFNYELETGLLAAKQKLKSLGYPEVDTENSMVTKAKSFISCATGKIANHDS